MSQSNQPIYRAYAVLKRDGQQDFWLNIGAAFAHQDGAGLTIALQALPLDGRVVLRQPNSDPQ